MNKHTLIVIIASIVIAAPFAYAGWSVYAVEQLEVRWSQKDKFNYFAMSNSGDIIMCNPLPFFVQFNKFEITPLYDKEAKGTFMIDGTAIPPNSKSVLSGQFSSENFIESQYLFMHLDAEFAGTAPIRIDPSKMFVKTQFEIPILGIFSYSVTEQYTGLDFSKIMNKEVESSCS